MRVKRNLGPHRIQAELIRLHKLKLSTATIWKVLSRRGLSRLRSGRTSRQPKSYSRDIPGERVQMDTVKIAPGLIQFTAVDDCTRMRVLALYPRRTAHNAARFLKEHVDARMPERLLHQFQIAGLIMQDATYNRLIQAVCYSH
jgi:hypothetical protein